MNMQPEIVKHTILALQVCVPSGWSNKRIKEFAETEQPCGTTNGWVMRKTGDELLAGDPERVKCHDRKGFIHVMFDA